MVLLEVTPNESQGLLTKGILRSTSCLQRHTIHLFIFSPSPWLCLCPLSHLTSLALALASPLSPAQLLSPLFTLSLPPHWHSSPLPPTPCLLNPLHLHNEPGAATYLLKPIINIDASFLKWVIHLQS